MHNSRFEKWSKENPRSKNSPHEILVYFFTIDGTISCYQRNNHTIKNHKSIHIEHTKNCLEFQTEIIENQLQTKWKCSASQAIYSLVRCYASSMLICIISMKQLLLSITIFFSIVIHFNQLICTSLVDRSTRTHQSCALSLSYRSLIGNDQKNTNSQNQTSSWFWLISLDHISVVSFIRP